VQEKSGRHNQRRIGSIKAILPVVAYIEPMLYVDIRLKAPTPGGFIRRELSRQLNGEDWILLFCRSISRPFQ
jgi:hypothetical protein